MYLIIKEGYKTANDYCLEIIKTGKLWVSMKNVDNALGVKTCLI